MSGRRLRGLSLGALVLLGGAGLLTWSQPWFIVTVEASASPVGGEVAAGAVGAVSLASLALVAALALAGPVLRVVFAMLGSALGSALVLVAAFALAEPLVAVAPVVTAQTGVAGLDSVARLVDAIVATGWPIVAIVVGGIQALVSLGIAVTARGWPASGRKYSRTTTTALAPSDADAIADWDSLSAGDDPTLRAEPGARDR